MTQAPAHSVEHTQTGSQESGRVIDIVSLYPRDMNIYGDSGNVLTISRRLTLYGFQPRVHKVNQADPWPSQVDMVLGGGGQDHGQSKIISDLFERADTLRSLAEAGVPMLMVCGLYQLFGNYFETIDGDRLDGIGIIPSYSLGRPVRMIGNLLEHTADFGDAIGYENHSGQTFLDEGVEPLGRVDAQGCGNNGEDGTEGARVGNVLGTYLHGSLLPKNPAISDFLIRTAVENRYGQGAFDPAQAPNSAELDRLDQFASQARQAAAARPR
ncbi:glutamine amidotransferase [Bombiscardovia apis]|uniref:Lipid II isoglutaminyl synthase (glutamine-hydrolyzing) subunit GatD n=1 Tax=Bombiscardovia apis TaxID=2932182 RepID=A0ABN6SLA1_9BIFI|nr:glutamine amidotransferase [Bombiscardovia apis]BDR55366.1 glutamine amidotransferase [Bombiscardovia apis]